MVLVAVGTDVGPEPSPLSSPRVITTVTIPAVAAINATAMGTHQYLFWAVAITATRRPGSAAPWGPRPAARRSARLTAS